MNVETNCKVLTWDTLCAANKNSLYYCMFMHCMSQLVHYQYAMIGMLLQWWQMLWLTICAMLTLFLPVGLLLSGCPRGIQGLWGGWVAVTAKKKETKGLTYLRCKVLYLVASIVISFNKVEAWKKLNFSGLSYSIQCNINIFILGSYLCYNTSWSAVNTFSETTTRHLTRTHSWLHAQRFFRHLDDYLIKSFPY